MTPSPGLMAYVLGYTDAGRIMSVFVSAGEYHDQPADRAIIEFPDGPREVAIGDISHCYKPDNQCTARPVREHKVTQFDERRSKEEWE